jgi:hypothetical protein
MLLFCTVNSLVKVIVPGNPVPELKFKFPQLARVPIVTLSNEVPEKLSKNTSSDTVGADAPGAPFDVADQFEVLVLFQVPVPPTQYLFAITQ